MTENTPCPAGSSSAEVFAGALPPEVLDALVKEAHASGGSWVCRNC